MSEDDVENLRGHAAGKIKGGAVCEQTERKPSASGVRGVRQIRAAAYPVFLTRIFPKQEQSRSAAFGDHQDMPQVGVNCQRQDGIVQTACVSEYSDAAEQSVTRQKHQDDVI